MQENEIDHDREFVRKFVKKSYGMLTEEERDQASEHGEYLMQKMSDKKAEAEQ